MDIKQRTGIAAGEYKRRRRQLMDLATDDALPVLPAASVKGRSLDPPSPYPPESDLQYPPAFPHTDAALPLTPRRPPA